MSLAVYKLPPNILFAAKISPSNNRAHRDCPLSIKGPTVWQKLIGEGVYRESTVLWIGASGTEQLLATLEEFQKIDYSLFLLICPSSEHLALMAA